jgi:putative endonuclease
MSPPSWTLYIIRTLDGCLYAGITTNVKRRYQEHLTGSPKAARFLRSRHPQALVFKRRIGSKSLALKVEYRFKQLTKRNKELIIETGKLHFDRESGKIRMAKSCFAESS